MKPTVLLSLYSGLMRLASPLLPLYLKKRAKSGKEDKARISERFGRASLPRPDGPLIWVHGASIGETLMAVPIIEQILLWYPHACAVITSGTQTSAEILPKRFPPRAFHQYLPADVPAYANRFLDHWQPDLCLWLESEIWPNIIRAAKKRNTPMLLLNARLSEKSQSGWSKRPKTAKALFGAFDEILTADEGTAAFLTKILDQDTPVFGNLKMGSPPLPIDPDEQRHISAQYDSRRDVWCAASTHKGEEEIMLKTHALVLKKIPNALLILAPRHPERTDEVITLIKSQGLEYAIWGEPVPETTSVYLIDKIGKLGLAYRNSQLVFMGGSMFEHLSGHNPMEPAHMSCAIFTGPHVSSFSQVYESFFNTGGAACFDLPDPEQIALSVVGHLNSPETRYRMTAMSKQLCAEEAQIKSRLYARLAPFLNALDDVE